MKAEFKIVIFMLGFIWPKLWRKNFSLTFWSEIKIVAKQ